MIYYNFYIFEIEIIFDIYHTYGQVKWPNQTYIKLTY